MKRLPYIDEHATTVDANAVATWAALPAVPVGFTLQDAQPPHRYALGGRHWFSTYRLIFVLSDVSHDAARPKTRVVAETWAEFPGIKGAAYRFLVISTRAHRVVVRRMLRNVAAKAHSTTVTTG